MSKIKPIALVILDGFGHRQERDGNAIALAKTPHLDEWFSRYPHTLLQASGLSVGLPEGYIGNSEVGHITIGAGRIIPQTVTRINASIDDGSFFTNPTLVESLKAVRKGSNRLHIMGLLSDAGVHCLTKHMFAYLQAAHDHGIKEIYIHPFLDGRDAPPKSAANYLTKLDAAIGKIGAGTIGSLHGRFYAMDRNKNWDRTEISYHCLTNENRPLYATWRDYLDEHYAERITDEFMPPMLLNRHGIIRSGDAIICTNFRPDRSRQLTAAFDLPDFNHFPALIKPLWFFTPVSYAPNLPTLTLLPKTPPIPDTFTDVLHAHNKRFFAIAETEKYAHVTYFFKGGRETTYATERQELIPSRVVRDYVNHPEMSACEITDHVIASLTHDPYDVYLINYANADMVGHSGNLQATIKAIEVLDHELNRIYAKLVVEMGGTLYLTGDHGNAELKIDPITKQPHTAHTNNPVPFIAISQLASTLPPMHTLADIAPYILKGLTLTIPKAMNNY